MKNSTCSVHPACRVLLCLLIFAAGYLPTEARHTLVMFTGNFNFDSVADTLYGQRRPDRIILPRFIAWGQCTANECAPRDSSMKLSPIPEEQRRRRTTITLPDWDVLLVSTSMKQFNTADKLDDLVFFLWGRNKNDKGQTCDTTSIVALFGQHGLDTLPVIDLAPICKSAKALQEYPFRALDLQAEGLLVSPKHRSKGRISYELHAPALSTETEDSEDDDRITGLHDTELEVRIGLYPNPGSERAEVEAHNLPAGTYTLELITLGGRRLYKRGELLIGEEQALETHIPLNNCASGLYIVRLSRNGIPVESIPFMVAK